MGDFSISPLEREDQTLGKSQKLHVPEHIVKGVERGLQHIRI